MRSKNIMLVSLFGSAVSSILGVIFFIVVSRSLGPNEFGLFSSLVAFMILASDVSDFGIGSGLARFVSYHQSRGDLKLANQYISTSFLLKFWIGVILAVLIFLFSDQINTLIFHQPQFFVPLIQLSAVGILVLALFSFGIASNQAKKRFFTASFLNVLGNLIRLATILLYLMFIKISIEASIISFIVGALLSTIGLLLVLRLDFFRLKFDTDILKSLLSFNKWLMVGVILYAAVTRVDNLLLINLKNSFEAGIYSAAGRVTFVFPILASSLAAVWAPSFSSIDDKNKAWTEYKKTLLITLGFAVFSLAIIPLAPFIVSMLFGREYIQAVPSLVILLIGWIAFLAAVPAIQYITYWLKRPEVYAMLVLVQFISVILLDFLLIPSEGAVGAAKAFLVGNFVYLLISHVSVFLINEKN